MFLSAVGNIPNYPDLTEDCSRGGPDMGICRNTGTFDRVRRDTGARPGWPAGGLILFWDICEILSSVVRLEML